MTPTIRNGTASDGAAAIRTIRRAISELCVDDHRGDERMVADWLRNKTEQTWHQWIARDDAIILVAETDGAIVGVGMVRNTGEVLLNYVSPDARFQGVSRTMLAAMEHHARACGADRCILDSTETARRFYLSCGYCALTPDTLYLEKRLWDV